MLKEFMEKIFSDYQSAKKEKYVDHPLVKFIKKDVPNNLSDLTKNIGNYKFIGYPGEGKWTESPYIAILDPQITNNLESGFYVLYIFAEDSKKVYLSLNQGLENQKRLNPNDFLEELMNNAINIRNSLQIPEGFQTDKLTGLGSHYYFKRLEAGNICSKSYNYDNLPSEEQFKTDLQKILRLYENIKYGEKLSDEQIKELLQWFVYSSDTNRDWMPKRRECERINHEWIQPEKIKEMSDEELKTHYLDYYNSGTGEKQNINAIFRDRIIRNENFRDSLLYLLNENIDIKKRINDLLDTKNEKHIEGMGRALITAFLMDFKPDKYCLWNGKTEQGFNALGWDKLYWTRGDSGGDTYLKVLSLLKKLKNLDPSLGLEFLDTDLFLHVIAAEKEGIDELNRVKHHWNGGNNTLNYTFFEFLTNKGYFFDSKLVENFLLSLKVKPFVILTGNSGTGKTKLAQLFAEYKNPIKKENSSNSSVLDIKRTITTYSQKHMGGWRIKPEELQKLSTNIYPLALSDFIKEIQLEINLNGKNIMGRGYLEKNNVDYSQDSQFYLFYDKNSPIQNELNKINDGEIIIRFYKKDVEIKKQNENEDNKHEIIPVGANWTENRHIIGFYNVITEKYQKTSALNLILTAKDDITNPYFLILDEMNLSHVERYFSDFLSAMESEEKIELYQASKDEIQKIDEDLPPEKIELSKNLMVIGTVNVDETTYMFSPKVLDRANTLEFLTQAAKEYMSGSPEYSVKDNVKYLQDPLSDIRIRDENISQLKTRLDGVQTENGQLIWDVLSSNINKYQSILKEADFDFGFRTINEIIRFMCVAWKYEKVMPPKWENWERYFDAQIMQKMLPKLHGSQKELSKVLEKLEQECSKGNFPTSTEKLKRMRKTLLEKRYVSFTG